MKTTSLTKWIVWSLISLTLSSCAEPDTVSSSSSGSSTTPDAAPPLATEASPLQLKIYTIYDTTQTEASHNFNESGTSLCEATDTNNEVTCTVEIPEARLYYSSVQFSYSWRNDKCKLMTFQPYYYRQSVTAGHLPPWADADVDCTQSPISADCFGGAAPMLVSGFPKYTALIHLSDPSVAEPQSKAVTMTSAFAKRYISNRHTANDADPAKLAATAVKRTFSAGDSYLPGYSDSYVNYSFTCQDDWQDDVVYKINLVIKDVDSSSTPLINHRRTWEELP